MALSIVIVDYRFYFKRTLMQWILYGYKETSFLLVPVISIVSLNLHQCIRLKIEISEQLKIRGKKMKGFRNMCAILQDTVASFHFQYPPATCFSEQFSYLPATCFSKMSVSKLCFRMPERGPWNLYRLRAMLLYVSCKQRRWKVWFNEDWTLGIAPPSIRIVYSSCVKRANSCQARRKHILLSKEYIP
jgi:hypothetical protein